jgi:predicted HTH transcriptional regulator
MVMERIVQMHEELYNPYPEFEEAAMELRERLRTPLADAVRKAERESKLEGAQKERRQILELITQKNYTLEQLKETLIRESQQAAESPR